MTSGRDPATKRDIDKLSKVISKENAVQNDILSEIAANQGAQTQVLEQLVSGQNAVLAGVNATNYRLDKVNDRLDKLIDLLDERLS